MISLADVDLGEWLEDEEQVGGRRTGKGVGRVGRHDGEGDLGGQAGVKVVQGHLESDKPAVVSGEQHWDEGPGVGVSVDEGDGPLQWDVEGKVGIRKNDGRCIGQRFGLLRACFNVEREDTHGDQVVGHKVPQTEKVGAVVVTLQEAGADGVDALRLLDELAAAFGGGRVLVNVVDQHAISAIKGRHLKNQGFAGLIKVEAEIDPRGPELDQDGLCLHPKLEGDPVLHWGTERLSLSSTDRLALGQTSLPTIRAFEGEVASHEGAGIGVDGGLLALNWAPASRTGGGKLEVQGLCELHAELRHRDTEIPVDMGSFDTKTCPVGRDKLGLRSLQQQGKKEKKQQNVCC